MVPTDVMLYRVHLSVSGIQTIVNMVACTVCVTMVACTVCVTMVACTVCVTMVACTVCVTMVHVQYVLLW